MESCLSARTLLCGLVLVTCVAWTNSFPLPLKMKEELQELKSTIQLNLTDTDRQEGGSIFKEQLKRMEERFNRDSQTKLVLEMLYTYSRLFHQMSKKQKRPAHSLYDQVQELLNNSQGKELFKMQRSIRDYKWNSVPGSEELKALNDFGVVYAKATALLYPENN